MLMTKKELADSQRKKANCRRWYLAHKDKVKQKAKETRKNQKQWFTELKESLSCEECGVAHPAIIDFHHIDPKEKNFPVSGTATGGYKGKKTVLEEIKKCKVLCSNCHRILHYDQRHLSSDR